MPRFLRGGLLLALLTGSSVLSSAATAAQSTPERPRPHALQGATTRGDDTPRTILIADGRIVEVLAADATIPASYTVIDAAGLVCVPSFLDAFSHAGCATPEPTVDQDRPADTGANVRTDMREANRKGIQPAFRATDVLALGAEDATAWSRSGFGALLSAPHGELLAGTSAVVTTRDAAARDLVVSPDTFHHAAFRATGPGYPSTLMGFHAQLRQFLMDAQRHAELVERRAQGRPGPRPPHDPELDAAMALLDGSARLMCEAETARDVHRWLALADEFGLRIGIVGGRDAWRAAAVLAEREVPVVLTCDWGDEPEDPREAEESEEETPDKEPDKESDEESAEDQEDADAEPEEDDAPDPWTYEEPFGVRLDKRLRWEERRDGARVLHEAGVPVFFGSADGSAEDLLSRVRQAVEAGFPADQAQRALGAGAAGWLGLEADLGGAVAEGGASQLTLWTGDPFEEGSQVRYQVTDGFLQEFEAKTNEAPAEGVDLDGRWRVKDLDSEDEEELVLELEMADDGALTGSGMISNPGSGEQVKSEVTGRVRGTSVELKMNFSFDQMQVKVSLDGTFDPEAGTFEGQADVDFENQKQTSRFRATRVPEGDDR